MLFAGAKRTGLVTVRDALTMIAIKLLSEGREKFEIPVEMILDDLYDDMRITVTRYDDKDCYVISLSSKNGRPIQDADFEIEVQDGDKETRSLPKPPLQIPSGEDSSA